MASPPPQALKYTVWPLAWASIGGQSAAWAGRARLRLTASGQLRPCLLSDTSVDVAGVLRNGCSDENLFDLFRLAAALKHERHRIGIGESDRETVSTRMSSIGG